MEKPTYINDVASDFIEDDPILSFRKKLFMKFEGKGELGATKMVFDLYICTDSILSKMYENRVKEYTSQK